jgi:hypothetical protein
VINWRFTDTGESLASTLEHRALTSIVGDAKAVSGLWALLVDFEPGFPIVEPGR